MVVVMVTIQAKTRFTLVLVEGASTGQVLKFFISVFFSAFSLYVYLRSCNTDITALDRSK
jgi:hypothetical protein